VRSIKMFSKTSWIRVLLFVVYILEVTLAQQDWCRIGLSQTLCMYPIAPGPACNTARVSFDVDRNVRDLIVSKHNLYRARVAAGAETRGAPGPQPPAATMNRLSWNSDLALIAQRWANQCNFASDDNRNASLTGATGPVVYVGQNVYGYLDPAATFLPPSTYPQPSYWDQAIDSWFNEVQFFNRDNVSSYVYQASSGHYTQVVWGATTDIGCGFTQWRNSANQVPRILVCNYGIGGNKVGAPVYTVGTVCSQCPSTTPTCIGSLCGNN